MNFQQLRIIRETVRRGFNLTEVASALFTSQSGVSRHIKDLEVELGIELFSRKGKRLLGLTEPGAELLVMVERMLLEAGNIKRLGDQYSQRDVGQLTVATTHTQARYALPAVITEFKRAYPKVHLKLHQASPGEIVKLLLDGEADVGVATEALADVGELASFPFYRWHHSVIVPAGHPLEDARPLTLEAITDYPIITYHEGFSGRTHLDKAFAAAGAVPDIIMSALDADVIKTYVELGLGVGIVASMAVDGERDSKLRQLDSTHLFPENVARIALRRGHFLRRYAYRFIELCAPELTEAHVTQAVRKGAEADAE